jgi:hypothetical protein
VVKDFWPRNRRARLSSEVKEVWNCDASVTSGTEHADLFHGPDAVDDGHEIHEAFVHGDIGDVHYKSTLAEVCRALCGNFTSTDSIAFSESYFIRN